MDGDITGMGVWEGFIRFDVCGTLTNFINFELQYWKMKNI
jgi:hypothetical protein